MSDDFDFNADDLFDDDFDDFDDDGDFGGDDDIADDFGDDDFGADLDLGFMDDEDDFGDDDFGDDDFGGDDFGDDDFAATGDEGGPGVSRPVMIIGGIMLVVLILFLLVIMYMVFGAGPSSFDLTKAAIETENAVIETQIAETSTQSSIDQTGTQEAVVTGTAEAIDSATSAAQTELANQLTSQVETLTQSAAAETAAFEAQETANAEGTSSVLDATELAQQDADTNATQTEISFQLTLNPNVTVPPSSTPAALPEETMPVEQATLGLPAVAQTATALAELFSTQPTTAPVQGTEIAIDTTQEPSSSTGTTTGTTSSTLPDTGLADDLFQAFFGDPRLAILAAFGLLGVIVVSRGVRSANRKREDDDE